MSSKRFQDAFRRLADAEDRFARSEFLAPVVRGGQVRVRIAGVVCRLRVQPADFEGWGVFRPESPASARLVRAAGLAERQRYLALFPMVRLILCLREDRGWRAIPAHQGDRRFRIDGMVGVLLADEAEPFEVVQARFDGSLFWFEMLDPRRDPATAAWLRESLRRLVPPQELDRCGLTPEERTAYAIPFSLTAEARRQAEVQQTERRLREALAHAGAELVGYLERRDSYRVTYEVGGRRHVSAVDKNDLTVQAAGICLSGRDQHFDLHSLVGVLRQAEEIGRIVHVGEDGIEEDADWDIDPPEQP